MRKVLTFVMVLTFLNMPLMADSLTVGPVAGLTMSTINEPGASMKPGFMAGAKINIALPENLDFESGLAFTQKGFAVELLGLSGEDTLNYLTIPLLAKWIFGVGGLNVNVGGGPEIGLFIRGVAKCCGETTSIKPGDLNTLDLGFTLGAGIEVLNITFDLRYTIGVTTINDESDRNNSFYILGGYNFNL